MKILVRTLYAISILLIAAGLRLEFYGTDTHFGYLLASVGGFYLIAATVSHVSFFQHSYWCRERAYG